MKKVIFILLLISPFVTRAQSFSYSAGIYIMPKIFTTQTMVLPTINTKFNFKKSGIELSFSYLFYLEKVGNIYGNPALFTNINLLYFWEQKLLTKKSFSLNINESAGLTHYYQNWITDNILDTINHRNISVPRGTAVFRGIVGMGTSVEYKIRDNVSIYAQATALYEISLIGFFDKDNIKTNCMVGVKYFF